MSEKDQGVIEAPRRSRLPRRRDLRSSEDVDTEAQRLDRIEAEARVSRAIVRQGHWWPGED